MPDAINKSLHSQKRETIHESQRGDAQGCDMGRT